MSDLDELARAAAEARQVTVRRSQPLATRQPQPLAPRTAHIIVEHDPGRRRYSPFAWGFGIAMGIVAAFLLVWGIVVLFAGAGFVASTMARNRAAAPATTPDAKTQSPHSVTSADLTRGNSARETSGKVLDIYGQVDSLKRGAAGEPIVVLGGAEPGRKVYCYFPKDAAVWRLRAGQDVVIRGQCSGEQRPGEIIVRDCTVQ